MPEKDTVNVEVSSGLVKPIIEAKIQAAIIGELGRDPQILVEAIVKQALSVKTNEKGNISRSSYENRYTFLEAMVQSTIREEARKAVEELMAENRDKIRAEIKKRLQSERGASRIASAVVNGIAESMKSKYNSTIRVEFKTND